MTTKKKTQAGFPAALAVLLSAAALVASPASAASGRGKMAVWLMSTGVDSNATAKVVYVPRSARSTFELTLRDLQAGPYDLLVGGLVVGTVDVRLDNSGSGETKGAIRFGSRRSSPLTFDPAGQSLAVVQGATTFFAGTFPATASAIRDVEFQVALEATGGLPGAEGEAEFRLRNGRIDFSVEIEDVPAGDYSLRVDGTVIATITAAPRAAGASIQGEVEFSTDLDEVGHLPLTFEPRGALIEVLQGDTPILSITFPSSPPAL